jgi:hypothetical protein
MVQNNCNFITAVLFFGKTLEKGFQVNWIFLAFRENQQQLYRSQERGEEEKPKEKLLEERGIWGMSYTITDVFLVYLSDNQ